MLLVARDTEFLENMQASTMRAKPESLQFRSWNAKLPDKNAFGKHKSLEF